MKSTLATFVLISIAGCVSSNTVGGGLYGAGSNRLVPRVGWIGTERTPHGEVVGQLTARKMTTVLLSHGIVAATANDGVTVPDADLERAGEVLLTDRWLSKSNLTLFFTARAGTATPTANGFVVPTTRPSN